MRSTTRIIQALMLALFFARPASSQTRNQVAIEATPFHGTLSYARGPADDVRAGFEVGFGFPQIDVTLAPRNHDFMQIAHVGVFGRFATTRSSQLDVGVRAGFSDLPDLGSDDFPDPYAALSSALLYGRGRFTFGARVSAGYAFPYGDPVTFVAGVSPIVRYTLSW